MKINNPNRKVGLVIFDSEVTIIGDGKRKEPLILAGDKLNNKEVLKCLIIIIHYN